MTKNLPKGVHMNNPYWTFLLMLASLSLLLPLYPAVSSIYFLFIMEFFSGMLHQMLWASKYWQKSSPLNHHSISCVRWKC